MDRALTWFIRIWVGLVLLANAAAIVGFFWTAPDFLSGWERVSSVYSPFNFFNVLAEFLALSPAMFAFLWRERRRSARPQ